MNEEVHQHLRLFYATQSENGRVSYTKADNLFKFYSSLQADGIEATKARFSKLKYRRLVKGLLKAGLCLPTNEKDNVQINNGFDLF